MFPVTGPIRVFYAHPASEEEHEVEHTVEGWDLACSVLWPGRVLVIPGRDDYALNFRKDGGWGPWARRIGSGRDLNGRPNYHLYIAPTPVIGKATAEILRYALDAGKPVWCGPPGSTFQRVRAVLQDDPEDYSAGWSLDIVGD